MANIPKIEIRQKGILTEIYIDGMRINGVRGFSISQKGGQQPTLTLDLLACDMTIDTACIPALPDVFKTWYAPKFPDAKEDDIPPLCIG